VQKIEKDKVSLRERAGGIMAIHDMAIMPSFGESIDIATRLLHEEGMPNPRLDAELLLQHVLKKNRLELHLARHELHDPAMLESFCALIERRLAHEPVAYLIGHKEFFGHDFVVTRACLIPRPDTEIVVEECLKLIPIASTELIIDLCTGSGAIAIALLKERSAINAIATDISRDALRIARTNAERLDVARRLLLCHGDLLAAVPQGTIASIIVANPPYIRREDIKTLSPSVRDYEPHCALDGDSDGLIFYRRILCDANKFLSPGGFLLLEIGYDQAEEVSALVDEGWSKLRIIKDLGRRDRCIVLQLRVQSEKS
jgi:release factor glutamine methyltransferase